MNSMHWIKTSYAKPTVGSEVLGVTGVVSRRLLVWDGTWFRTEQDHVIAPDNVPYWAYTTCPLDNQDQTC